MTRKVDFSASLPTGMNTFSIRLCDKYMHPLASPSIAVTTGASIDLEVNDEDTCWVAMLPLHNKAFWVYANMGEFESVQKIDLDKPVYRRNILPSLLPSDDRTLGYNVEKVMGKVACGEPVVCEEEQRLLCRYSDVYFAKKPIEDVDMCRVDNAIYERVNDGRQKKV